MLGGSWGTPWSQKIQAVLFLKLRHWPASVKIIDLAS